MSSTRRSSHHLFLIVCLSISSLLACESKKPPVNPAQDMSTAAEEAKLAEEKEAAKLAAEQARFAQLLEAANEKIARHEDLNEREYELLVLSLEACDVDAVRGYVDVKCEEFQTLKAVRATQNKSIPNQPQMWKLIAEKSLTHRSAAVRIYATQLLTSSAMASQGAYSGLLEASKTESSPAVLQAQVRALRIHTGKDRQVAARMLELSNHPDNALRESVIIGLTSTWASGSQDTLERAMEMIEKDPSEQVRRTGCANIGARADDRAMPLLEKYTAWPAVDDAIYGDCLRGLVGMWSAPVSHKQPSKAAYELSLARFSAKPRGEEHPAWMAISSFSWATRPELIERAAWVDVAVVKALLVDLIEDHDVKWLGRNSAITSLVQMGATREDFIAIRKRAYGDVSPDDDSGDRYVLNKLNEQIDGKFKKGERK